MSTAATIAVVILNLMPRKPMGMALATHLDLDRVAPRQLPAHRRLDVEAERALGPRAHAGARPVGLELRVLLVAEAEREAARSRRVGRGAALAGAHLPARRGLHLLPGGDVQR